MRCLKTQRVLVTQSCLTLCDPMNPTRLLCPWNSAGKNIGEGSHSLFQGIFSTQRPNLDLLHFRQILHCLGHQGSNRQRKSGKEYLKGNIECSENLGFSRLKNETQISTSWRKIKWYFEFKMPSMTWPHGKNQIEGLILKTDSQKWQNMNMTVARLVKNTEQLKIGLSRSLKLDKILL